MPAIHRELHIRTQLATAMGPIGQTVPEDIFIVGYPKSGNTWVQNLVVGAIFGLAVELAPDTLVQSLVPEVHKRQFYRRYQTPTFFKTHHLPRPEYRRVIYLLRDGRDVMVSYYHFLAATGKVSVDFSKVVLDDIEAELFPCRWDQHVSAWIKNPYGAEILIVKYEDLREHCLRELIRICSFAGFQRDKDFLERVVKGASFDAMQRKESELGWDDGGEFPRGKQFVRRGVIGAYRDEMPETVLRAFMEQAADTLRLAGYATS